MSVYEAQNLTPHEIKTIITRAGEGTKIVFTGDIYQIDHPYLDSQSNGLSHLIEKMRGQRIYAHVNLEKGERSDLAELASRGLTLADLRRALATYRRARQAAVADPGPLDAGGLVRERIAQTEKRLAAAETARMMWTLPAVEAVTTSSEPGNPEIKMELDR